MGGGERQAVTGFKVGDCHNKADKEDNKRPNKSLQFAGHERQKVGLTSEGCVQRPNGP